MVAEGTSAQVTVFPGGEGDAGARRLWETLGRLAGPSGSWSGTQAELAACFTPRVSERTLRRWMNALRADDVLQTRGTGTALEYALLRWPAGMQGGSQRATVLAFTPRATPDTAAEATPDTPDTTPDIESEADVRGSVKTPDTESASRARFLSHHPHHPTSDISTPATPKHDPDPDLAPPTPDTPDTPTPDTTTPDARGHGRGDGSGGGDLTPWAQLQVEFRLAPTTEMVDAWIALGEDGQRAFRVSARRWPPRHEYTPPSWFWKVHTDAVANAQGDRLRASLPSQASVLVEASRYAPSSEGRKEEARAPRPPWWRPFVMPAAVVCAAFVIARRGGVR